MGARWGLVGLVVGLGLFGGGCRTRLLDGADGGAGGGGAADLACAGTPVVLDGLEPADKNMCPADLIRVSYRVRLGACVALGSPQVTYDPGRNAYTLVARTCPATCGAAQTVVAIAYLTEVARPRAGTAEVRDGAPGGMAVLELPIQPADASGQCGSVSPGGCRSDAECEAVDPATRCSFDLGRCVHLCAGDADCPAQTPRCGAGVCS